MDYIPVEKKTVGFLPKRGNLSKAFSLEVRYHSTTNIQRYMGGETQGDFFKWVSPDNVFRLALSVVIIFISPDT